MFTRSGTGAAAIAAFALATSLGVSAMAQGVDQPAPAATGAGAASPESPAEEPDVGYEPGPRPPDLEISLQPLMSDDHPALRAFISANPGREVIVCLAGCDSKPGVISVRVPAETPKVTTVGEHVPSGAALSGAAKPASSSAPLVCVAGC